MADSPDIDVLRLASTVYALNAVLGCSLGILAEQSPALRGLVADCFQRAAGFLESQAIAPGQATPQLLAALQAVQRLRTVALPDHHETR